MIFIQWVGMIKNKFEEYKEKILIIVAIATGCEFTPQYKELEKYIKNIIIRDQK